MQLKKNTHSIDTEPRSTFCSEEGVPLMRNALPGGKSIMRGSATHTEGDTGRFKRPETSPRKQVVKEAVLATKMPKKYR